MAMMVYSNAAFFPKLFLIYLIPVFSACNVFSQNTLIFSLRVVCGFGGALFVYTHRKIVDLRRHHRENVISRFLEKR